MANKKLQQLNNVRPNIAPGDQFAIGGADGFTYRAELTVLQEFLLESSLTTSTTKSPQSVVVKTAIDAINVVLTTDNVALDDFQKITDAIEAIQATLSVNDAAYDTLQKVVDKLKTVETKLATIESGAEVNVQADWSESDNTSDAFIQNKPALGTASSKNVGTAIGDIQENGAILGNLQTVETDSTGKLITAAKNTAYNANFGTGNTNVARGDASYLKAETYTQSAINTALATKEAKANKGVANGYAGLDSNAQVPLSQLPANAKSSKVVADIATRDVIANADRFEGLRVHVLDASADSTVTNGGAGYILKSGLANTDWEKTYESESLDIDLSVYLNKTTETLDDVSAGTTNKHFTATLETKLNSIEDNATADQTAAEIKTAYESNVDTNAFTDAEKSKLAGVEPNATSDQSDSEIKTAYENNADTNAFTDAEKTKLAGVELNATADTTTTIQTKRPLKTIENQSLEGSGNIDLTSSDVGLGNVDNTSDADKPISTAQQTALDGKLAKASNLSDVANRQTALDNLTDVSSATGGYVLTKDPTTGNAEFQPAPGGSGGTNLSIGTTTGTTLDINSDTGSNATIPAATPSNAGLMTSADKTKLNGVEVNATADQTDSEIKIAYENNADTNAFTDAEKSNLANQSGTNTGDEVAATETTAGIVQYGTTSGTATQGNDARLVVKRLNVLIGTSTTSQKKGVTFNYGTTITNPFFSLAMTSADNNDAFTVKIINITTTSAKLEVYRADATSWGDTNVACFVTIYSGTY